MSGLAQVQLRALLRSHNQPANGSKATLAQRVAAFMSDRTHEATGDDDEALRSRRLRRRRMIARQKAAGEVR